MSRPLLSLGVVGFVMGCAGGPPPAAQPTPIAPAPPPAKSEVAREPAPPPPPERFAAPPPPCEDAGPCTPPVEFARAMCEARFEALALTMFEKQSPWQRLYLKAEYAEAVNAHDKRVTAEPLVFGEEVIVLRSSGEPARGGLRVTSSDIDVLRWDGTCATVAREMFVTTMMPSVEAPPISWRHLGGNLRAALLKSKYVKMSYEREKQACQGESAKDPSPPCAKARDLLQDSITVAVRGGIALPIPDKLPVWATEAQKANSASAVALSD